jgi:hypothetical protein
MRQSTTAPFSLFHRAEPGIRRRSPGETQLPGPLCVGGVAVHSSRNTLLHAARQSQIPVPGRLTAMASWDTDARKD